MQGIAGLVRIPYTGISDELCCANADFAKTSSGQLRERNGSLVPCLCCLMQELSAAADGTPPLDGISAWDAITVGPNADIL